MNFRFEIVDRVARLTLNRPEAFNAMTPAFWRELDEVLGRLQREAPARVLVIDSTGRHFSAGMSLEAFGSSISLDDSRAASRANIALLLADMQRTFDRLAGLRMPVIAAIQGGCIGGGVDLVCACDLRYCTSDAFFCVQEINIGLAACGVCSVRYNPMSSPSALSLELAW